MTYADDMVLLAKSEEELKGMMKRFENFLERKDLEYEEVEGVSI